MTTPIRYIDSHTEGEPTRVIIEGGPDLGCGSLLERRRRFAEQFDDFRSATVLEPRGSDAVVGALLCKPVDTSCTAGVIFYNNRGYLGMCGHGMLGLAVTLAHMGRISAGIHRIETPVGVVEVNLLSANEATVENVPSYRYRKKVDVEVSGLGLLSGSIAWGG
ncbi:MAG TPA: proline racemase family protein, partial [Opitutales bacterium]|nr:proline racemase family protein [Opitutales bacterium]